MNSKHLGLITQEIQDENRDLKVLGKSVINKNPNGLWTHLGYFVVYSFFEVEVKGTFPSLLASAIKHWPIEANIQDPMLM